VEAWVFTVARRTIADLYRDRERGVSEQTVGIPESGTEDEEWKRENLAPYSGEHDVHEEVLSWLRPMAEELPEDYSRPLIMADFEGYTQQEVADEIGLSLSGAKSRVQRARTKLKQRLRECCELEFGPKGRVEAFRRLGGNQGEA
jgi:RNA polymerase sigma-70 factor (ECF subfamily)